MLDLSIIIVNYNSKKILTDCLNSIISSNYKFNYEVFVIDNNSSEKINDLESCFPQFIFIYNDRNLGFSGANNIGIRRAKGKKILLLNPDTIVNENSFDPMIKYLDEHADTGVVGCRIFNAEGDTEKSTHSFPNLLKEFFHANEGLKRIVGYNNRLSIYVLKFFKAKSLDSYWNHDSLREVDHVTGACMMVKKEIVDKTGMLDEAFFLYNEEVEWSMRIKKAGYKIIFLPESNIIHLFGYSTKQRVQKWAFNNLLVERYRGIFYLFSKHYGFTKLFILRIIVLQGFCFRLIKNYIKYLFLDDKKKETIKLQNRVIMNILRLPFTNNFDWRTL